MSEATLTERDLSDMEARARAVGWNDRRVIGGSEVAWRAVLDVTDHDVPRLIAELRRLRKEEP